MKTVILHIGTGKTGTSSIQQFLFVNREALRKSFDIDYIDYGLLHVDQLDDHFDAHYRIVESMRQGDARVARELAAAVARSPCSRIVLSCENFYHHLKGDGIRFLADALSAFNTRIICYLRRQDSCIESGWKQQIKVGASRDAFEQFRAWHSGPSALATSHVNYYRMLVEWRNVFGRDAIGLRVFDRVEMVNGNLLEDFMAACGVTDLAWRDALVQPPPANGSLPSELMLLLQRVNVAGLVDPSRQLEFVAYLRGLTTFRDPPLATPAERRAVVENYAGTNERLFAEFLARPVPACFTADLIDRESPAGDGGEARRPLALALRCLVGAWQAQTSPQASRLDSQRVQPVGVVAWLRRRLR